jgi:hypothetical protein
MRWFSKGKPKELWDEVIQWPIDDLEAGSQDTRHLQLRSW